MKYFLDTEFHEYQKQPRYFGFKVGESVNTIELISIGLVDETGREYYAVCNEFDVAAAWNNEWLRENVLKKIFYDLFISLPTYVKSYHAEYFPFSAKGFARVLGMRGKSRKEIAEEIVEFVYGDNKQADGMSSLETAQKYDTNHPLLNPEFYAYYADYDWVVFCWLFGRMIDLPKGFPMYCRDLKQTSDEIYQQAKVIYEANGGRNFILELKNHLNYPGQSNEHNALDDAKWNKKLFDFLYSTEIQKELTEKAVR